ncbi:hypothetical protein ACHAWF_014487, partial [Thalassiosira exigua]
SSNRRLPSPSEPIVCLISLRQNNHGPRSALFPACHPTTLLQAWEKPQKLGQLAQSVGGVLYKQRHGHCNVPQRSELGRWVSNQHQLYKLKRVGKKNHMTDERIRQLEAIGLVWSVNNDWEESFSLLEAYKQEHGYCNVPTSSKKIGRWVKEQRRQYKQDRHGLLSEERIRQLNTIGCSSGSFGVPPLSLRKARMNGSTSCQSTNRSMDIAMSRIILSLADGWIINVANSNSRETGRKASLPTNTFCPLRF